MVDTQSILANFPCFRDAQCLQRLMAAPNGGDLLAIVAVIIITLTISPVRNKLTKFLLNHWPAALFLLVGAAVYLYNASTVTFVFCILTVLTYCAICVRAPLWHNGRRFPRLLSAFLDSPRNILFVGMVFFPIALIANHVLENRQLELLLNDHERVLVTFTLPSEDPPPLVGAPPTALPHIVMTGMRDYLLSVSRRLRGKVLILPGDGSLPEVKSFRAKFPPEHPKQGLLAQRLFDHGVRLRSPIDLAISTKVTVVSSKPYRVEAWFGLFRLHPPYGRQGEPELRRAATLRLVLVNGEHNRVALLAAAHFATVMAWRDKYVTEVDRRQLWSDLNQRFRSYYDELNKPETAARELKNEYDDKNCAGFDCVRRWVKAYSIQPDTTEGETEFRAQTELTVAQLQQTWKALSRSK